jgi:hypothetical protein
MGRLLAIHVDKEMDYSHDSVEVLNDIAALISQHQNLCCSTSTQVRDLLISYLDMKEIGEVPETLVEFVNLRTRRVHASCPI